jgi:hypothetical protein
LSSPRSRWSLQQPSVLRVPWPSSFLVVDILSEEFERTDRRGPQLFFGRRTVLWRTARPTQTGHHNSTADAGRRYKIA